jgi:hypothetical protein
MKKIDNAGDTHECALGNSLSAIKQAHNQLHSLTGKDTTAAALAWQIELCNVLLVEISGIRSSLVNDLNYSRGTPKPDGRLGLNA